MKATGNFESARNVDPLAVLSDEEQGGVVGAQHLVTERPELLDGV